MEKFYTKYFDLLNVLYGNDYQKILAILNLSVRVEELEEKHRSDIVIHTGFIFKTQNDEKMELLYDSNCVLRQIQNKYFPVKPINGLWLTYGNYNKTHYSKAFPAFRSFIHPFIERLSYGGERWSNIHIFLRNKEEKYIVSTVAGELTLERTMIKDDFGEIVIEEYKSLNSEKKINTFKFFENEKIIKEFPLHKNLDRIVFFDGKSFTKYLTESEQKNRIIKKEDYSEYEKEVEFEDIIDEEEPISNQERHGKYSGTWAQDVEGLSDNFIDDVLDGNPEAYWNID
jgi:hypothetical protein